MIQAACTLQFSLCIQVTCMLDNILMTSNHKYVAINDPFVKKISWSPHYCLGTGVPRHSAEGDYGTYVLLVACANSYMHAHDLMTS